MQKQISSRRPDFVGALRGFCGLRHLRAAVGDAFIAGVGLYLGPSSYTVDDRLYAIPVDRLWSDVR